MCYWQYLNANDAEPAMTDEQLIFHAANAADRCTKLLHAMWDTHDASHARCCELRDEALKLSAATLQLERLAAGALPPVNSRG